MLFVSQKYNDVIRTMEKEALKVVEEKRNEFAVLSAGREKLKKEIENSQESNMVAKDKEKFKKIGERLMALHEKENVSHKEISELIGSCISFAKNQKHVDKLRGWLKIIEEALEDIRPELFRAEKEYRIIRELKGE